MNDSHEQSDLEQMLARQPLTPPSRKLDERMADLFAAAELREDSQTAPHGFAITWVRFVRGVAACIAVAGLVWLATQMSKTPPQTAGTKDGEIAVVPPLTPKATPASSGGPREFNPVRIEQVWADTRPEGVVMVDGDPLRRFRRQTVQRVQLIDDKNNVRIEYTVPREEVVVTPVRYD